jgi:hypothetical protein
MAKMTYRTFDALVQDTYRQAQENLRRDGTVHQALMGFDVYGRNQFTLLSVPESTPEHEYAKAAGDGVILIPGVLRDYSETIGKIIADTRTVAVIHVGEAWTLMGNQDAQDGLDSGRSIAEHPNRIEIVYVAGTWPREFYTRMLTALIFRDDDGQPLPKPSFSYDNNSQPGPIENRMSSWLADLLPRPFGR